MFLMKLSGVGRWRLGKVSTSIIGKRMYLRRAVDCDGEVLDILI